MQKGRVKKSTENIMVRGFKKQIKGKKIVFHKDFKKGWQLALCPKCGYSTIFMGKWIMPCDLCNAKNIKVYSIKDLEKFIMKQQEVLINART